MARKKKPDAKSSVTKAAPKKREPRPDEILVTAEKAIAPWEPRWLPQPHLAVRCGDAIGPIDVAEARDRARLSPPQTSHTAACR